MRKPSCRTTRIDAIRKLQTHKLVPNRSWINQMIRNAKFQIGQIVKHRIYPFRGVVFDVDPIFDNSDEWYEAIPEEIRPSKEQPYYHLFAENEETEYIAYVSEQNLLADDQAQPLRHPQIGEMFKRDRDGQYVARDQTSH